MSNKQYQIGDKVSHDFSGGNGVVVAIRKDKLKYTHQVKWEDGLLDWFNPIVLKEAKS